MLPAPSVAVTVIVLSPGCRPTFAVQEVPVRVAVPLPPRLLLHVTLATWSLSVAVPPIAIVAVLVRLETGVVKVMVGWTVSYVMSTKATAWLPAASVAVTVTWLFVGKGARATELIDHEVVPVAVPPPPVPVLDQVTVETPDVASLDVPEIRIGDVFVL